MAGYLHRDRPKEVATLFMKDTFSVATIVNIRDCLALQLMLQNFKRSGDIRGLYVNDALNSRVQDWLVGCFGFNGPLRQYFSLYRTISQREGERGDMIEESKNVQTTPTSTYCKRNRPLPYYHPNCRTPRHWKVTQDHRTTWPPPTVQEGGDYAEIPVSLLKQTLCKHLTIERLHCFDLVIEHTLNTDRLHNHDRLHNWPWLTA